MFTIFNKDKQNVPIKIWRNNVEEVEQACLDQAVDASNHPAVFRQIVLAPDCHKGYGTCWNRQRRGIEK